VPKKGDMVKAKIVYPLDDGVTHTYANLIRVTVGELEVTMSFYDISSPNLEGLGDKGVAEIEVTPQLVGKFAVPQRVAYSFLQLLESYREHLEGVTPPKRKASK